MKNIFLFLFLIFIAASCSDDSSSNPNPNPNQESHIKASTTQADYLVPVSAGNTYIYKNISDSVVYDTLHAVNKSIRFTNPYSSVITSDITCYHNSSMNSFLYLDWQICGYNIEKKLFMTCWSGKPEDLVDDEVISPAMFFYDTLEVGSEIGDLTYRGKENIVIEGKTYQDCYVYDDFDNPNTPGSKKLKIYLYKGIGLLKTVQVSKSTNEIVESLTLYSCNLK